MKNDVFLNPVGGNLLLDVQSSLLSQLSTRVCVPLIPQSADPGVAKHLNPVLEIAGERYIMKTEYLSAVPASMLKEKVGNLDHAHDEIVRALDFLFLGF